jgi:hypothetical protein
VKNALGNNMHFIYFSCWSAVSLQIKMWEMLIAMLFDVPYYVREREREIFLLLIGERATKVQGCNVTK